MKLRFWTWLILLLVLAGAGLGLGFLLIAQGFAGLGRAVVILGDIAVTAWIALGLYRWRHVAWVSKLGRVVLLTLGCGLIFLVSLLLGFGNAAIITAGAWAMAAAFFLGMELLRLFLSPGVPLLSVARTLLDEAIRMRLALIFVVMLVVLVPFLPFTLSGETRLQYRLQSFITYALTVVSVLLSLMTILLAVRTISSELSERQIFLTMTKPIGRIQYLLGKWLGIALLNLLLLSVSGLGIYAFVRVIERQPAMDALDRAAVRDQVLVARASQMPSPVDEAEITQRLRERLGEMRRRDPATFGQPGDPLSAVPDALLAQIRLQAYRNWLTVAPNESTTYRFTDLGEAKATAATIQLHYKATPAGATDDQKLRIGFRINGRPYQSRRVRADTFQNLFIPTTMIREDGTLDVTVINGTPAAPGSSPQPTISFNPADGIEVFYRVGGFTGNLVRSLAVLWIRLGFLAMVGLAFATFLGFPIACVACLLVYFTAAGSGYLAESFSTYASMPSDELPLWEKITAVPVRFIDLLGEGQPYEAFKLGVSLVGQGFTLLIPSFGQYNPTPRVAYGRVVGWPMLGWALLNIGVIGTGLVGVIAAAIFRRREIARITV